MIGLAARTGGTPMLDSTSLTLRAREGRSERVWASNTDLLLGAAMIFPLPARCLNTRIPSGRKPGCGDSLMLPKPPPRLGQLGHLYFPPYRVEGYSIAGEATAVMVPEFDVCFDIGLCGRPMLSSKFVALTHGHMDHVAGLPYYFSQRWFQGMGMGVCVCDRRIEPAVRSMMAGWVDLEQQRTAHEIIGLSPGELATMKELLRAAIPMLLGWAA